MIESVLYIEAEKYPKQKTKNKDIQWKNNRKNGNRENNNRESGEKKT